MYCQRIPNCGAASPSPFAGLWPGGPGLTNTAFTAQVRLSYAKVAEYQRRGVVHFHAIIRPRPWKLWDHGGARSWPARARFVPYGQPESFAGGDPPYQDVRDRCPRCRLSALWVTKAYRI